VIEPTGRRFASRKQVKGKFEMALRIGIIGLGTIGKTHWKVIRESPQTTLIAVADPTPSALDFARAESRAAVLRTPAFGPLTLQNSP
jgi:threonine dehydrogenase-like Zn-dependent dehydrogenase